MVFLFLFEPNDDICTIMTRYMIVAIPTNSFLKITDLINNEILIFFILFLRKYYRNENRIPNKIKESEKILNGHDG